ncbi:autophagy-related protein 22-like protein [Kockovaella imperatae]|uniref:Autophagy-related protein n=1 Tax=Kockovaella imperatae TaxID=4999 RepID=A0A1Y1UKE5_9TREE|nr:autophagy-related protein 22-like protein [Kockovaella imperatae]ORX38518.1 autophagy-related protein 22-like protein [Kockovaella imperatae]
MYVKSAAVIFTLIMLLSVGSVADRPYWRKGLLIASVLGATISSVGYYFFPQEPFAALPLLTAVIMILSISFNVMTSTCFNGYLGVLARRTEESVSSTILPSTMDIANRDPGVPDHARAADEERRPLLRSSPPGISLRISRLSSTAFAIGLIGSIVCQFVFRKALEAGVSMVTCFAVTGLWTCLTGLPAMILLPARDPIVKDPHGVGYEDSDPVTQKPLRSTTALLRLFKSLGEMSNLRFAMLNWVLASDVCHTMPLVLILQSTDQLAFTPADVTTIALIAMSAGAVSSTLMPHVQAYTRITTKQILLVCTFIAGIQLLMGSSTLLNPHWGYKSRNAVFGTVALVGVGFGGYYSYARALWAELIPKGRETSFFSLYAIADRSASFFGPLMVAAITQSTGRFDYAWFLLLIMMLLSIPPLLWVNVEQGKIEADRYLEKEEHRP